MDAVLQELAALRVVSCGLAHERVRTEAGTVLRRAAALEHDPGLVRAGLCTHELRARQLSCAHTRARITLDRAIAAAAGAGLLAQEEAQRLRAELGRLDHAVHMSDWDKSRAELQYAQLLEREGTAGSQARQACEALAARHTQLGAELAALHAAVLARLAEPSIQTPTSSSFMPLVSGK